MWREKWRSSAAKHWAEEGMEVDQRGSRESVPGQKLSVELSPQVNRLPRKWESGAPATGRQTGSLGYLLGSSRDTGHG